MCENALEDLADRDLEEFGALRSQQALEWVPAVLAVSIEG